MDAIFGSINSIANKLKVQLNHTSIDNLIFKLHYRYTVSILIIGTILVTSRELIGDNINCIFSQSKWVYFINQYCFFHGTFTVKKYNNETMIKNMRSPYPGIGPISPREISPETIIKHLYYQWVPFVLFLQAIMFYMPHLVWKSIEDNRLKHLIEGTKQYVGLLLDKDVQFDDYCSNFILPSNKRRIQEIEKMKTTFLQRIQINKHWAYGLLACEVMNLMNALLQIYLTNLFLQGRFYTLGFEIIKTGFNPKVTVLSIIFPKVSICYFRKYGPSGTLQLHDALCIMPLNIINEKIYLALWFWYVGLIIFTVVGLAWRFVAFLLHSKSEWFNKIMYTCISSGKVNAWKFLTLTNQNSYSEWLLLRYISKNMDSLIFKDLINKIANDIKVSKMENDSGIFGMDKMKI